MTTTVGFERQDGGANNTSLNAEPTTPSMSVPASYSIKSQRSQRSQRSSRSSRKNKQKVVFASASHYHPLLWFILAFPLVAILIQIILVSQDPDSNMRENREFWNLGWSLVLVFVIYMLVLPRQLDVRSNGSIGVKTFLGTYRFKHIARAYQAGMGREDFLRPRLKFATTFFPPHRVIVRRKGGRWDLVITPSEPEDFIQALDNVLSTLEQEDDGEVEKKGEGREDLSLV